MTADVHEEARQWIALEGKAEPLPASQQERLEAHLEVCESCRDYWKAAVRVVQAVQFQPIETDLALMQHLQGSLRLQAIALRQTRQRLRLALLACAFVAVSAGLTMALFWQASSRLGTVAHSSTAVLQTGFALFWTTSALFVSAVLLLRGTHANGRGEMQWH